MACQPVTSIPIKTKSPSPNLKINDAAPIPNASMVPSVPQTPPVPSVPAEPLSLDPVDQNNNQTEIGLVINDVTKNIEIQTNTAQEAPKITPKAVAIPKTFNPKKIIGFGAPILVLNLGMANMVRKEGPIEIWQFQFGNCVVDFFFYPTSGSSSQPILKSWDMRSSIMGDSLDRGSCHDEMNLYHQKFLLNS